VVQIVKYLPPTGRQRREELVMMERKSFVAESGGSGRRKAETVQSVEFFAGEGDVGVASDLAFLSGVYPQR